MLSVDALDVAYGEIRALKGVALEVGRGEIVALLGNNGAGKTTTLKTISGLLRPKRGTVTLDGEPLVGVPPHEIVLRGIAHVPEGRRIFNRLTVRENLMMGAYLRRDAGIANDLDRVFALFPRLEERIGQVAGTLSGGEQQMLAIGRALMLSPRLLLLDEPSMGLAPVLVEQIFDTVADINHQGTTILLVEQNAAMALSIAHRGYVLETGTIALTGTAAELSDNADVRRAYLGEEDKQRRRDPMRAHGLNFEQHEVGATYRTLARTVSETDIVTFVNLCGFSEPLFMDMEYVARESVFKRRAAPGALTFALSEGLIMQTGLIHGTGMAYLGGEIRIVAPVLEGDTLTVEVEVADKRETKQPDRGIVTYRHRVLNQRNELVLEAKVQRMIRRAGV